MCTQGEGAIPGVVY